MNYSVDKLETENCGEFFTGVKELEKYVLERENLKDISLSNVSVPTELNQSMYSLICQIEKDTLSEKNPAKIKSLVCFYITLLKLSERLHYITMKCLNVYVHMPDLQQQFIDHIESDLNIKKFLAKYAYNL